MQTYFNSINGKAVGSSKTFQSINPAADEVLGLVPVSDQQQVNDAISAARAAQPAWEAMGDKGRQAMLMRVADAIRSNSEYLAQLVTAEQGKPLGGVGPDQIPGSRFEMWGCEVWTQVPASMDLPIELAYEDNTRRDEIHRKPHGVVAAIAPWNWPLMIAIWQIIPALRTGNTVVLKPSEYTSICSLEMVRLIAEVLPPGVLNTVSGAGETGALLVENEGVDKITFTGSTATGIRIASTAARRLIPTTMELGGNDAAIVLPDVEPNEIAMGLFWGAFLNMGQTCACAKRLYVHESIHDIVVDRLKEISQNMPMGNGMEPGIAIGPIQNRMQFDKVNRLVELAKNSGANIVCGGEPSEGPGNFFPPTLITNVRDGDPIVDEEQFGPVLPIIKYKNVDEAIKSANRLNVGLGASVWSSNVEEAQAVAQQLCAGTVWINQHGMVHPMVPFGGVKSSGWGVEFGLEGLKGMTRAQVISIKKN